MKTPIEILFAEMNRIRLEDESGNISTLEFFNQQNEAFEKAKEAEKLKHKKMVDAFIKNIEQTRPLIFENGFVKGFEFGLKCSEQYYDEMSKTQLADDDFTREYLQKMSNEIYNEIKETL